MGLAGREMCGRVPGERVILTETRGLTRQLSAVGVGVRDGVAGGFRVVECEAWPSFEQCVHMAQRFRLIL